jgi:hypothetical protein
MISMSSHNLNRSRLCPHPQHDLNKPLIKLLLARAIMPGLVVRLILAMGISPITTVGLVVRQTPDMAIRAVLAAALAQAEAQRLVLEVGPMAEQAILGVRSTLEWELGVVLRLEAVL